MDFFTKALCVELEMPTSAFFEDFEEATYAEKLDTIAICKKCPVQKKCSEFGRTQTWGLWGGVFRRNGKVIPARKRNNAKRPSVVLKLSN